MNNISYGGKNKGPSHKFWIATPPQPAGLIPDLDVPRPAPCPVRSKRGKIDHLLFDDLNKEFSKGYGFTPLMNAVRKHDLKCVEDLIYKGISVNAVTRNGLTALMIAARNGDMKIAKILCENGADVNSQSLIINMKQKPQRGYNISRLDNYYKLSPFQTDYQEYKTKNSGFTPPYPGNCIWT